VSPLSLLLLSPPRDNHTFPFRSAFFSQLSSAALQKGDFGLFALFTIKAALREYGDFGARG